MAVRGIGNPRLSSESRALAASQALAPFSASSSHELANSLDQHIIIGGLPRRTTREAVRNTAAALKSRVGLEEQR
jgi:hypothetical protein